MPALECPSGMSTAGYGGFAAPPDGNGERVFSVLRSNAVIVRHFPGKVTGRFVRITVGTDAEIDRLLEVLRENRR